MNSFEMFLAQVDPATIARESFTGEGHRQMVREHLVKVARFEGTLPDVYALVTESHVVNARKPKQPRKPKQQYRPGGSKSLGYQELQRVQALTKKEK